MSAALFLALFLLSGIASASDDCVYVLYVETGSVESSGTNAKISMVMADKHGGEVKVDNLEAWGLMGASYDYFEKGNIDSFGGRGTCLNGPVCFLNLTSDNTGSYPSWYCDVVEVTATGPHDDSHQTFFHINQWLSTDKKPYQLFTQRNYCSEVAGGEQYMLSRRN
ncbi:hypothetical protein ACLOJK_034283 [Asimina triloba]